MKTDEKTDFFASRALTFVKKSGKVSVHFGNGLR